MVSLQRTGAHTCRTRAPAQFASAMDRSGLGVVHQGALKISKLELIQILLQAVAGRLHQGAMEGSTDRQGNCPPGSPLRRKLDGSPNRPDSAGNHHLSRRVEVGRLQHLAPGPLPCKGTPPIPETFPGERPSLPAPRETASCMYRPRFLTVPTASGQRQAAGSHDGAVLPQAVAGHELRGERPEPTTRHGPPPRPSGWQAGRSR